MRRLIIVTIIGITALVTGCTGKTAIVRSELLPAPNFDFKSSTSTSYHVDSGQFFYHGGPSTFAGSALKVSINLKQIQEDVGNMVANNLFTELNNNSDSQNINISSTLTNFSYRIPTKLAVNIYAMISFDMNITARDKDGKLLYTNSVSTRDYESTDSYFPMVALTLFSIQSDSDKLSQLVSDTTAKRIYEIYIEEFAHIAKRFDSLAQKQGGI